ncbi:hypothetical protein OPT61_g5437 [Boeremia exigua]|uniref:Uncharacterized protein n=1 Tax=Boeremia exigua TaxID=749465 RepID=A0ACC2IAB4_9PLEO|nr:hypothetical protein OPT61_g5437 [Boeremia exigua]
METDKDATALRAQAQANTNIEHSMTLRDAVRMYPKSVLYCVVLSMAIIMEGYQVGLVPSLFAQPAFQRKYGRARPDGSYQLDSRYQSALTAAVQTGSIFGYWLSGLFIEKIGYKKTTQGALFSITCFIFVTFFAPSIILLVIGEGLLGIPWGIIQTLTTTYAAEVSPVALRAYLTSYINLCWVIGIFISTGVLRGTVNRLDQWAYRIPFALQWIWPIPIIIGVSFAPESPWWLIRKNRVEDARKALMDLTSTKNAEHDIDSVLAMIRHTVSQEERIDQGASYRDCFRGASLRRTEITCVAGAIPFLAGTGFTGQAVYFLSVAGLSRDAAYNLGLGQNALSFVGVLTSWALMHRFGRRSLYLWGLTATCVILLLVGILGSVSSGSNKGPTWAMGALMMAYMFVYSACLGPVAYAVVGETPSSRHRNKTVAIARIFLNLLNFGGSWLNPAIINPTAWGLGGKGGYIWFGIAFATLVWTIFRLPEMMGRTYGEIDDLFQRDIPARQFADASAHVAAVEGRTPSLFSIVLQTYDYCSVVQKDATPVEALIRTRPRTVNARGLHRACFERSDRAVSQLYLTSVLTTKRANDGSSLADGLPGASLLFASCRSLAEQDADRHIVYFLPVTNVCLLILSRPLNHASSRKRRCTYVTSLNSCKECISKDAKCSLSELGGNATDRQRGTCRILLPSQQQNDYALYGIHSRSVSSPLSIYDAPNHEVCTELVELYFDLIHDKQHILFHPQTFMAQYHAGKIPDFLIWGMAALVSRFTDHACFASIPRSERGRRWLDKALRSFNDRVDTICISALQGTILLGMACFAEGETAKEDLLSAQAIRMVQVLQLPDHTCPDVISFEVQVRLYWQVWMMDMWHAARAQYPRQLRFDVKIPKILEEKAFYDLQDHPLHTTPYHKANRTGLWSTMLPLSEIHSRVMHLNYILCDQNEDAYELPDRVGTIAEELLSWHRALPEEMHYTPVNIARVKEEGLFRPFNVLHILYHFQFQLLYYQYLQKDPGIDPNSAIAKERETYTARCKAHAIAMSEIFWAASSQKGTECFWSPVNGHLLVVASSIHLHTLLFDTDEEQITATKKLLEQNFAMLLQLQEYWPSLEHSMMRLRAFHKTCLLNAEPSESFNMDDWTAQFLNRYHMPVEDRQSTTTPEEKFYGSGLSHFAIMASQSLMLYNPPASSTISTRRSVSSLLPANIFTQQTGTAIATELLYRILFDIVQRFLASFQRLASKGMDRCSSWLERKLQERRERRENAKDSSEILQEIEGHHHQDGYKACLRESRRAGWKRETSGYITTLDELIGKVTTLSGIEVALRLSTQDFCWCAPPLQAILARRSSLRTNSPATLNGQVGDLLELGIQNVPSPPHNCAGYYQGAMVAMNLTAVTQILGVTDWP